MFGEAERKIAMKMKKGQHFPKRGGQAPNPGPRLLMVAADSGDSNTQASRRRYLASHRFLLQHFGTTVAAGRRRLTTHVCLTNLFHAEPNAPTLYPSVLFLAASHPPGARILTPGFC